MYQLTLSEAPTLRADLQQSDDTLTLQDLLRVFVEDKQLSISTARNYHSLLKQRLNWLDLPVSAITNELIDQKTSELEAVRVLRNQDAKYTNCAIALVRKLISHSGNYRLYRKPKISQVPPPNSLGDLLVKYCKHRAIAPVTADNYHARLRRAGWDKQPISEIDEQSLADKMNAIADSAKQAGKSDIWIYQTCKMLYCLIDFAREKGLTKVRPTRHWKVRKQVETKTPVSMPPMLKRFPKAIATSGITFGEMSAAYIEHYAKLYCRSWEKEQSYLRLYLTDWNDTVAANISKMDVQVLLRRIGEANGKTAANRAVQLIRTIYNRAIEWEIFDGTNPATGARLFKLQSRDRFLEVDEIKRLIAAASTLRYPTTRDFLFMCLFTAARRSNVAAMRWEEISFETGLWSVPLTKNGTPQRIPLTKAALDLLSARKQNAISEFVFPSDRSKSGHLTKPEGAWYALLERAGLKNVRIHDLRRTMASWQAMTGANLSVIMDTLNHKDVKSVQVYARLQVEPVRESMSIATAKMLSGLSLLEE
jgi:integrase